jgi:hypothetical protein
MSSLTNNIAEEFLADPNSVDLSKISKVSEQLDSELRKKIVPIWRKWVLEDFKRTGFQEPSEWVNGRIVLPAPAKPISGIGSERVKVWSFWHYHRSSWWLPKPLMNWFILKLPDDHKGKGGISPEAERLLVEKAKCWFWLFNNDTSKTSAPAPAEWVDGKIVLPPLASKAMWRSKTGMSKSHRIPTSFFDWYVSTLPKDHVKKVSGYSRDVFEISDFAAKLLVAKRDFFESVRRLKRKKISEIKWEKYKIHEISMKDVAAGAGLSRGELKAKLDRLSELASQGYLNLACDMIADFDNSWLFEALLAGAAVEKDGTLKPGKELKRFKEQAEIIMIMAIAHLPEGASVDESLYREAEMAIDVTCSNLELLGRLASLLPALRPAKIFAFDFKNQSPEAIAFLSRCKGDLDLHSLTSLSDGVAQALVQHKGKLNLSGLGHMSKEQATTLSEHVGDLTLGLKSLTLPIAKALSAINGDLFFCQLKTITPQAAEALATHSGTLSLGVKDFLSADTAKFLAQHDGPVALPSLEQIEADAALAFSEFKYRLEMDNITEFPTGISGVVLCEQITKNKKTLFLIHLKRLQPDCAFALAKFPGCLWICVDEWNDAALIALANHKGALQINPKHVSDEVGRALGMRAVESSLCIGWNNHSLTDVAAEALGNYLGELSFFATHCTISMSVNAAAHLVKRQSMNLRRKMLKPAVRKIFEAAGKWQDYSTWTCNP